MCLVTGCIHSLVYTPDECKIKFAVVFTELQVPGMGKRCLKGTEFRRGRKPSGNRDSQNWLLWEGEITKACDDKSEC